MRKMIVAHIILAVMVLFILGFATQSCAPQAQATEQYDNYQVVVVGPSYEVRKYEDRTSPGTYIYVLDSGRASSMGLSVITETR